MPPDLPCYWSNLATMMVIPGCLLSIFHCKKQQYIAKNSSSNYSYRMFTAERHLRIANSLAERGHATIAELASELGVSTDTIRRDLRVLEQEGVLRKMHGGAIALDVALSARTIRSGLLVSAKQALGAVAASYPDEGATIFIDAGTTLLEVARQLPRRRYTVITHALDIAMCLSERPEISLHLAGGAWDARQRLFDGACAEAFVRRFRADWALLGACAADVTQGLMASEASDAEIKRGMLAASERTLLVADHSKFGQRAPHWVADLTDLDIIVTDRSLPVSPEGPFVHIAQAGIQEMQA
jgi:DeoR family glycerol-3-phosphate regulon repressor